MLDGERRITGEDKAAMCDVVRAIGGGDLDDWQDEQREGQGDE